MIRAIGFDLDNTLFDHTEAAAEAMRRLILEKGWIYKSDTSVGAEWHRVETIYFSQYAAGIMTLVEQRRARMRVFLKSTDAEVNLQDLDELWNDYLVHYAKSWVAYADVHESLGNLKASGIKMAVLTNGQQAQQEAKLYAIGLADMFEGCLAIGTVEALKPDPRAFEQLSRLLECEPHEVLFVGDDIDIDVRASINAGLHGVWLNRDGVETPDDITHEVHSLAELGSLIRKKSEPLVRPAARILMMDENDRVLLFRGKNSSLPGQRFWFPPGGGIENTETAEEAAKREAFEETGLSEFELGPHIWNRRHVFEFNGLYLDSRETWFFARVPHFDINTDGFTEVERLIVQEHRWWSVDELDQAEDTMTPRNLAELVRELIVHGLPTNPITIPV